MNQYQTEIENAQKLATWAHRDIYRKYTTTPIHYITHCKRVADEASRLCFLFDNDFEQARAIAGGWLHDVIEDCPDLDVREIIENCPTLNVASLVIELTNPSTEFKELNRKSRKELDFLHLGNVSKTAKIIKLIDRLDNLTDLDACHESGYIRLYCEESLQLLGAIGDVDGSLKYRIQERVAILLERIREN